MRYLDFMYDTYLNLCTEQILSFLSISTIPSLSYYFTVMPDNSNFPYRRYDRLPPIQQFSIESDTDLSETAELIEEYDVFDPARPRPKIILVIGMKAVILTRFYLGYLTF